MADVEEVDSNADDDNTDAPKPSKIRKVAPSKDDAELLVDDDDVILLD